MRVKGWACHELGTPFTANITHQSRKHVFILLHSVFGIPIAHRRMPTPSIPFRCDFVWLSRLFRHEANMLVSARIVRCVRLFWHRVIMIAVMIVCRVPCLYGEARVQEFATSFLARFSVLFVVRVFVCVTQQVPRGSHVSREETCPMAQEWSSSAQSRLAVRCGRSKQVPAPSLPSPQTTIEPPEVTSSLALGLLHTRAQPEQAQLRNPEQPPRSRAADGICTPSFVRTSLCR